MQQKNFYWNESNVAIERLKVLLKDSVENTFELIADMIEGGKEEGVGIEIVMKVVKREDIKENVLLKLRD